MFNPRAGDRVVVDAGRWAGKAGRFLHNDVIYSGQVRLYPVVLLDSGRQVRVASVSPEPADYRPTARTIAVVQVRHVERHARQAIGRRLGHAADYAVIAVRRDEQPRAVLLHLNSGGNAIAVETALRAAGYRVEKGPAVDYGVTVRVLPTLEPAEASGDAEAGAVRA